VFFSLLFATHYTV